MADLVQQLDPAAPFGKRVHSLTGGFMGWKRQPSDERIIGRRRQCAYRCYALLAILNKKRKVLGMPLLREIPYSQHAVLGLERFQVRLNSLLLQVIPLHERGGWLTVLSVVRIRTTRPLSMPRSRGSRRRWS